MADGVATESAVAEVTSADAPTNPYVDAPPDTHSGVPPVVQQAVQIAAAAEAAFEKPRLPVRGESLESRRVGLINQMKAEHGEANLSKTEEALLRLFMNEATIDAQGRIQGMPDKGTLHDIWSRYRNLEENVKFDDEGIQSSEVVILPLGNPTNAVIRLHHMLTNPTVLRSFDRIGLPITQIELNYLTGKKMTPVERKQLEQLQGLRRVTINTANLEVLMYKNIIRTVGEGRIIPLDNYDALFWDYKHESDVAKPDAGSVIATRAIQEAQARNPQERILVLAPPTLRKDISGLKGFEIPIPQVNGDPAVPQPVAA